MKPLRIVIAGGGTGGHLYPGIAVAREILRRNPNAQVSFAGTERGIESRVIPREGFALDVLRSAGLKGKSIASIARGVALLPLSGADAWRIVEQYQLQDRLPRPVIERLQAGVAGEIPDTPKPDDPIFERVHNAVIGSNRIAAQAAVQAAQAAGFEAQLLTTFVEGEAREVARVVAGLARGLARQETPMRRPACLVNPALDGASLQRRVDFLLKANQLSGPFQVPDAFGQVAITHWNPHLFLATQGQHLT